VRKPAQLEPYVEERILSLIRPLRPELRRNLIGDYLHLTPEAGPEDQVRQILESQQYRAQYEELLRRHQKPQEVEVLERLEPKRLLQLLKASNLETYLSVLAETFV
jgi:hypothetical protein